MELPIYRMSEVGMCPRALTAQGLGYEPIPETEEARTIMRESQIHEHLVIAKLSEQGYEVGNRQQEVDMERPLFTLRGHIDGIARKDGQSYLLEVKALGRFSFYNFIKQGIDAFPEYTWQVSAYYEAIRLPIMLAIKCRDTGQLEKRFYQQPFIPFQDILDKLTLVDNSVREQKLLEYTCDEKQARYCKFRYLCDGAKDKETAVINTPSLLEAAVLWREGKKLEQEAEEKLAEAKEVFLNHAKANSLQKFLTGGVSVSYLGVRSRAYIDEALLKTLVDEDIIKQVTKAGKPWEDIRIRAIE